jgi:cell division protein DivIC
MQNIVCYPFHICNFTSTSLSTMNVVTQIKKSIEKAGLLWENSRNTGIGRALRNKYVLTSLAFLLWLLLFDQNNLAERRKSNHEYNQLIEEKAYYLQKIEEDRKRINELKTNTENLEKFAREQYLMKKDNEDIFVIVEE